MQDQPTATVTPMRKSRATRAANVTAKSAPAKRSAPKATAPEVTPKVTAPKSAGPTRTEKNIVANAMVATCAKLAATWNPKTHGGVSAETATRLLASWLNYAPLTEWPASLGERSGAGGRGAANRQTA